MRRSKFRGLTCPRRGLDRGYAPEMAGACLSLYPAPQKNGGCNRSGSPFGPLGGSSLLARVAGPNVQRPIDGGLRTDDRDGGREVSRDAALCGDRRSQGRRQRRDHARAAPPRQR